jgi:AcrR family transcriptional regulator
MTIPPRVPLHPRSRKETPPRRTVTPVSTGAENLSPARRLELVSRVVLEGQSAASVARDNGVSRQTVQFWLRRYRRGGADALNDKYVQRRTETYGTIRAVAAGLIARQGFEATSLRQIAHQLGLLQVSSLHNHISSKNSLVFDIVERTAIDRIEASRAIADISDASQRFRELVRYNVIFEATRSSEERVFRYAWHHLSTDQQATLTSLRRTYQLRFDTALREGIRENAFRDLNVDVTVGAVLAMSAWLSDVGRPHLNLSVDALADAYADLAMRAVRRPSRSHTGRPKGRLQESP